MHLSLSSFGLVALTLASSVAAHTRVWSVYVNGVDQGSGNGIRDPIFEGPPAPGNNPYSGGSGYNNWPMRNVLSPDMLCHVRGDIQDSYTIDVYPGDILTFDWHHDWRNSTDDIIAGSHSGPCLVYLSPDPPSEGSWVKIQEQGEYAPGKWCTTTNLIANKGRLNTRIPADLAPGPYLIRPELIALHESDTQWINNNMRGAQLYFECIQLNILGTGTATLPPGVSFPGAYAFSDPGINYHLYSSSSGQSYIPPGPTVWSGAYPSPTQPSLGPAIGSTSPVRWCSWVNGYTLTQTVTYMTAVNGNLTAVYTPSWSTTYNTPTPTPTPACQTFFSAISATTSSSASATPSPVSTSRPITSTTTTTSTKSTTSSTSSSKQTTSTSTSTSRATTSTTAPGTTTISGPLAVHYGQCGGTGYVGPTTCAPPYKCTYSNAWYSQCL